ncbi:acyltransferase [Chryseobacterium flavum]|uniref:acyltransferase n=1 Tax=Chryseobacterium flavum TaxID=415851 RepID=UPI0028A89BC0|nr:acyltransferase [Chryseobacterium flavum]
MGKIVLKIISFFELIKYKIKLNEISSYIDRTSQIMPGFRISNPRNIIIEGYVYIGPNSFLSSYGMIHIKRGTIIGPNLIVHTANHNYLNDIKSIPYDHELIIKDVTIEENVWIGDSVIILPGVSIGEGSIIAAGSVVVKNIPKFSIVGGNPAKVIKERPNIEDYLANKTKDNIYLKKKYEH